MLPWSGDVPQRHSTGPSTVYWLASTMFSSSHIHPAVQMVSQAARLPLDPFTERQHQKGFNQHHETHLHGNAFLSHMFQLEYDFQGIETVMDVILLSLLRAMMEYQFHFDAEFDPSVGSFLR